MPHNCPLCGNDLPDMPVAILPDRGMVVKDGKFCLLTGYEVLLLQRLAEMFPRVVTRQALLEWMYQISPDAEPEIKIIDVYVCKARKKLASIGLQIDTVWGTGYALRVERKPIIVAEAA